MKHYDLIVAGGGFSGVCAAVSAARRGLSVLLFDRFNALGGAAVTNLVLPFMPYWTKDPETQEKVFLSKGVFAEICGLLEKNGALERDMCFNDEILKIVLNEFCLDAGVELLFNAALCNVTRDDRKIRSVTLTTVSGLVDFSADYFIDATGDGNLSFLAGCEYQLGREDHLCQPMTLCFRLGQVHGEIFNRDEVNEVYRNAQKEGRIKNPRENVLVFSTLAKGVFHFNTTRIIKLNPTDVFDQTKAEIEARRQIWELFTLLKEKVPAFRDAVLLTSASQIGIRESRMISGRHLLTAEELKACVPFEDSVAVGNYDIDIHNPEGTGTYIYSFEKGQYYHIPYGSLCPLGTDNLLVAGRCISCDHEAQASIRIMPICATLGQAAGTAAAIAKQNDVSVNDINIKALQDELVKDGAKIY